MTTPSNRAVPVDMFYDVNAHAVPKKQDWYIEYKKYTCICKWIIVLVGTPIVILIVCITGGKRNEPAYRPTFSPTRVPSGPPFLKPPRLFRVIIDQTATENCYTEVSCKNQIEQGNFNSPFLGLKKTYFVGGDGSVQETHYFRSNGVHAPGLYLDSISITFIGTFSALLPTEKQILAAHSIIQKNIDSYDLVKNYRLYGARQFMTTDSPGNALYDIIKKWPNWSK